MRSGVGCSRVERDGIRCNGIEGDGIVRDVRCDGVVLTRVDLAGIRGADVGHLRVGVPGIFRSQCRRARLLDFARPLRR